MNYYLRLKSLSNPAREYQCVNVASLKGPVTQHSLQRFAREVALRWGQGNGSATVEVTLEDDRTDLWTASIVIPSVQPGPLTLGEAASIADVTIETLCLSAVCRLLDEHRLTVEDVLKLHRKRKECVTST